jgi:propionyl-CoA carboxylase alpha chain
MTTSQSCAPRLITALLVANRGEIARRVFRTCRSRGIATVAVFSDADADSPHVRDADRAVRLPGVAAADTYLRADLLLDAAGRAGADAVHPGYGFLSENADFARAVIDAGLTWVGPGPEAIALMGSKVAAKDTMREAGVPVQPRLDAAEVTEADLPLIVKASAGGGGRGMRVVRHLADLEGALVSAAREASSAFGDATVFLEPYLATGRHVEVQVLADTHGRVWTLGERECSIQRRHQKIIEESPSPLVDRIGPDLRAALMEAARRAATAIGYVGAGTVEFLADHDGSFSFLEMNTRLQVEHPVTENVTGVDLVGLQLDVAEGRALEGDEPAMRGHAIEARLYAEDATTDWRPQSGTLHRIAVPGVTAEFDVLTGRGIRLDAGVVDGSAVSVHYDSMLAKVVATAPTRHEGARLLAAAIRRAELHGVRTNRDLLVAVLTEPEFLAGDIDTAYLDRHDPADLARSGAGEPRLAAVAAALADAAWARQAAAVGRSLPGGWRNLPSLPHRRAYAAGEDTLEVAYRWTRDGLVVETPKVEGLEVGAAEPGAVVLVMGGVQGRYAVRRHEGEDGEVHVDGPAGSTTLRTVPRFTDPSARVDAGSLRAPMPGVVTRVAVDVGEAVDAGTPLLWLEAMKMEHVVTAATGGTVVQIVPVRTNVEQGTVLAVISDGGHTAPGTVPTSREANHG